MNQLPRNRTENKPATLNGKCQRGFAMVSAVFLLVVLAGLGAAMVNFSIVQHTSAALDVEGTRAYQAARAGIEWGLFRAQKTPPCPVNPSSFRPPAPTLNRYTVTVRCTAAPAFAGAPTISQIRTMTSVACSQPDGGGNCPGAGGVDYVERQLQVTF